MGARRGGGPMSRPVLTRLLLALALLLAGPALAAPGLWVIRDADTEITLFGTVHALPSGETWLVPPVTTRLDAADTLVLEAIIPEDKSELVPLLATIGTRPGLPPLAKRLPPALAKKFAAAAAAAHLPLPMLDRMTTWLAAITLSETNFAAAGLNAADGVEPALTARAKAAGKPVIGIETIEQQLRFFDNLPPGDQVKLLEATLDDAADIKTEIDKLVGFWRAGDVDTIARDFAREAKASPLLARVLVTDRNVRWADWIAGVMKRPGKVFVAVGAGHLGGPDGLLALLKARGFTPEPVKLP